MKSVLICFGLVAILSCKRNADPKPELTELIIGKWKLISISYFSQKEGKYKTENKIDPNYYVSEFVRPDTLFAYSVKDSSFKKDCPHIYHYQIGKFLPDNSYTLPDQIRFSTDCSGNDAGYVENMIVTSDSLILEPQANFKYKYVRIK